MSSSPGNNGVPSGLPHGNGYSADVRLYLILSDGTRLRPGQVGHDRAIFREPVSIRPGPAVVEVIVDGQALRRDVVLAPHSDTDRVVMFADAGR